MNNEIKEILAYFEEYIKITDMHDSEPMLNWKDLKIVLDYITNLQEENRILKELNICVGCNNNPDCKLRIDKAIEKIHDMYFRIDLNEMHNPSWVGIKLDITSQGNELLNILQGEHT